MADRPGHVGLGRAGPVVGLLFLLLLLGAPLVALWLSFLPPIAEVVVLGVAYLAVVRLLSRSPRRSGE